MKILKATRRDAPRIAALHTESWRKTYRGILRDEYLDGEILAERTQFWAERFEKPAPNFLVLKAVEGRGLLGFVCVWGDDDPVFGALLDNLHVRPDLKGQGIGKILMQRASQWLSKNYPQRGMYLWVYEKNEAARRVYEHLGGETVGWEIKENPGGGAGKLFRISWSAERLPIR